jgi:hypothetical protein
MVYKIRKDWINHHLLVGDHATIACNSGRNEARPMTDERFVYPEMFKRVRWAVDAGSS